MEYTITGHLETCTIISPVAFGIEYSQCSNSPTRHNNKLEDNMIHNDKSAQDLILDLDYAKTTSSFNMQAKKENQPFKLASRSN